MGRFITGTPGRSPVTYQTRKGFTTYNPKTRTYSGPGVKPKGSKTRQVPTTIVTRSNGPTGTTYTTSGFSSPAAASAAVSKSKRGARRVRRIANQARAQARARKAKEVVALSKKAPHVVRSQRPARPKLPPTAKPSSFEGHKTVGEPTLAELRQARNKEKLGTNKAGFLTTPNVRHAIHALRQAEATAMPQIEGITHPGEATQFAESLAKSSHLDPRFVGAWVQAEGGGFAAGGEAGKNNWLGVGYPGSPTPFGRSAYFAGSGKKAGKATANWIKGKIGSEYGYGAAQGIQEIIPKAAGKGPAAALQALEESGWGTNVDSVRADLAGISAKLGNPKKLKAARSNAKQLGLNPKAIAKSGGKPSVNYLKVFGKQVAKQLKLVKEGKYTTGPGKLVLDAGVEISQGHEPEIAARLKMLSAKVGQPVYIISGHRTPQHSVEVGGFANDPHTEAKAADIGVGAPTLASAAAIPESVYESVGLYRPFGTAQGGSSQEDNHVQLLNGGTPAVGSSVGGAAGTTGSSGGSTGLPTGAVSSFAAATGQSPKQVRHKLRKGKLTPQQILNKLAAVGAGVGERRKAKEPEVHPVLQEMIEKYGSGGPGVPTEAAERRARKTASQVRQ